MKVTGNFAEREGESETFTKHEASEKCFLCLQFGQFSSLKSIFYFIPGYPYGARGAYLLSLNITCNLI